MNFIGWSKLYPKFQKTKRNLIRTSYLVVSLNINDSVDLNQQMTKRKPWGRYNLLMQGPSQPQNSSIIVNWTIRMPIILMNSEVLQPSLEKKMVGLLYLQVLAVVHCSRANKNFMKMQIPESRRRSLQYRILTVLLRMI